MVPDAKSTIYKEISMMVPNLRESQKGIKEKNETIRTVDIHPVQNLITKIM